MAVYQSLTLTQLSQDAESNTSQVRILWQSTQTGSSYNMIEHDADYWIGVNTKPEELCTVAYYLPRNTAHTIVDRVITVPHNDKGEAELQVRTWMHTRLSAGVVELTEKLTLDTIPRASTVLASDGMIGGISRLAITKKNSLYHHSIGWEFAGKKGYVTENGEMTGEEVIFSGDRVDFQIPDSFYIGIPNAKSGICTLSITTYDNGSLVGQPQSTRFTVSVDESVCCPIVGGNVVDTNEVTLALTGDQRKLVRYYSRAHCQITAAAQKGAAITRKQIQGALVTGDSLTVEGFSAETVRFEAEDSRGFTAEHTEQVSLVKYVNLSCECVAEREDPVSGNASLYIFGDCYAGSFGAVDNELSICYSIDGGEPVALEPMLTEDHRYYASASLIEMDYTRVYGITVWVSDKLSKIEKQIILKKGVPVFDWGEEDFVFHVPVKIEGDLEVTGSLTVNGEEKPAPEEPAEEPVNAELEFVVERNIQDRNSVCVVEETGADVSAADNSAYFDKTHLVVQKDTYRLDKDTMLSLQNKKLVGNGSVSWKDWDNIAQGWKDTFDPTMLSGALKVRYADDPVYLSMKLPSEANFETDTITRPGMRASDYAAGNLVTVNNIGAIYPIDYTQLPDEIVICIGNLSLYTLSKEPNAKWKLHDKCSVPAGYAMYALPWSTSHDANVRLDDSKVSVCDGYMRFTLEKEDFAPMSGIAGSLAKTLHFWGNHNELDLMNNAAVITFYEVWVETPEAVGNLYVAPGCDRKSSDGSVISQNFWGRNVLLSTGKTVITGHNISDTLYEALRDTPNDTRLVYADYASVRGGDYDVKRLQEKVEKDLSDKGVKLNACFSALEITEVTNPGVNINPGVYETGYIDSGIDYDGYHNMSFRTKGYIKVESGRTIALYYDSAEWNNNDNGKSFYIYEYDINKSFIRGSNVTESELFFPSYVNGKKSYTLSADTVYIRICYNNWRAFSTPVSDIKAAIYYLEDARLEFVEYYADIEAVYGVKGDRVILTAPNGARFSLSVSNDGTLKTNLIA